MDFNNFFFSPYYYYPCGFVEKFLTIRPFGFLSTGFGLFSTYLSSLQLVPMNLYFSGFPGVCPHFPSLCTKLQRG